MMFLRSEKDVVMSEQLGNFAWLGLDRRKGVLEGLCSFGDESFDERVDLDTRW